jgi:hypothetical protein
MLQPAPPFRTATVEAVFRYWSGKRQGPRLPGRRDVHPEDIPALLPWLFLVEVAHAPQRFRFRLVGTRICELAGRDHTGISVNEAEYGPAWRAVFDAYDRAVRSAEPQLDVMHAPWPGREFRRYERIVLPLAADGRTVDMLLGALSPVPWGPAIDCRPLASCRQ